MWKSNAKRPQWIALVVSPNYKLEAMHGANNDIGHLGLKQMLDILCDGFYWPDMEVGTTHHVCTCELTRGLRVSRMKQSFTHYWQCILWS